MSFQVFFNGEKWGKLPILKCFPHKKFSPFFPIGSPPVLLGGIFGWYCWGGIDGVVLLSGIVGVVLMEWYCFGGIVWVVLLGWY